MEATGLFVPRFHKNQGAQNSAKDIHEERIEMYFLLLKNFVIRLWRTCHVREVVE